MQNLLEIHRIIPLLCLPWYIMNASQSTPVCRNASYFIFIMFALVYHERQSVEAVMQK